MNWKFGETLIGVSSMAALLFSSASAQQTPKSKFEPLTIQGQGSFAVGGKVITNPGSFNPKQPTPEGQTLHGDHAYGDFIPDKPSDNPGRDGWRVRLEMARKWRDTVNRHGGDATVVHLPEVGIRGNTHFPFSDLNNKEVADQVSKFLSEKKLDY
jgi:hypothetical protein